MLASVALYQHIPQSYHRWFTQMCDVILSLCSHHGLSSDDLSRIGPEVQELMLEYERLFGSGFFIVMCPFVVSLKQHFIWFVYAENIPLNAHMMFHIPMTFKDTGSLAEFTLFMMEDVFGRLTRGITATRSPAHTFIRRVLSHYLGGLVSFTPALRKPLEARIKACLFGTLDPSPTAHPKKQLTKWASVLGPGGILHEKFVIQYTDCVVELPPSSGSFVTVKHRFCTRVPFLDSLQHNTLPYSLSDRQAYIMDSIGTNKFSPDLFCDYQSSVLQLTQRKIFKKKGCLPAPLIIRCNSDQTLLQAGLRIVDLVWRCVPKSAYRNDHVLAVCQKVEESILAGRLPSDMKVYTPDSLALVLPPGSSRLGLHRGPQVKTAHGRPVLLVECIDDARLRRHVLERPSHPKDFKPLTSNSVFIMHVDGAERIGIVEKIFCIPVSDRCALSGQLIEDDYEAKQTDITELLHLNPEMLDQQSLMWIHHQACDRLRGYQVYVQVRLLCDATQHSDVAKDIIADFTTRRDATKLAGNILGVFMDPQFFIRDETVCLSDIVPIHPPRTQRLVLPIRCLKRHVKLAPMIIPHCCLDRDSPTAQDILTKC